MMNRQFAIIMMAVFNTAMASAQDRTTGEVGVLVGSSSYDLNGTGSELSIGAMVAHRPMKGIILELATTYFGYSPPVGGRVSYLIAEVGVDTEIRVGALRPFLGAGAGLAMALSNGPGTDITLHAAGGLRVHAGMSWDLVFEARARAIDPFKGSTFELRGGLTRRLW